MDKDHSKPTATRDRAMGAEDQKPSLVLIQGLVGYRESY